MNYKLNFRKKQCYAYSVSTSNNHIFYFLYGLIDFLEINLSSIWSQFYSKHLVTYLLRYLN